MFVDIELNQITGGRDRPLKSGANQRCPNCSGSGKVILNNIEFSAFNFPFG